MRFADTLIARSWISGRPAGAGLAGCGQRTRATQGDFGRAAKVKGFRFVISFVKV